VKRNETKRSFAVSAVLLICLFPMLMEMDVVNDVIIHYLGVNNNIEFFVDYVVNTIYALDKK